LLFTEPEFNASEENFYNLKTSEEKTPQGLRSFDVLINDVTVQQDLNPARDFGRISAGKMSFLTRVNEGLTIKFKSNSGKTLLSGIKIERL